jgi:succinate dehydrogenase/fumarate reductase flavoprotein subunit
MRAPRTEQHNHFMTTDIGLHTDVLVVGGGLAGTWAATAAAREGARVILAEKGYVGTSGVTATAGPGHWWVPPDPPGLRAAAIAERAERGLGLADPAWMARVIDLTWRSIPTLAAHYRFHTDASGATHYRGMRGPEYMRAMRQVALEAGVTILDQSPALELLLHKDGAIAGARGQARQNGTTWSVRAGAVVIATGGCAFFSHLLGSRNNTGDGCLMAAEAGAPLSGMEFSSYYTVAAARTTMTRSMSYIFGRYFDEAGRDLEIPPGPSATDRIARALMQGRVFCTLERTPADIRAVMPHVQPNFVAPFDRWGVDPYTDRFEITLRGEGTVRGIGGIRVADESCGTGIKGLFVAGDAASRENVAGAVSGGGAQNSAWAVCSGQWAGQGAARQAREAGARAESAAEPAGSAGLRSRGAGGGPDLQTIIAAVQAEMEPPEKNLFRTGANLIASRAHLDSLWSALRDRAPAADPWRAREAASALATARWCLAAALARTESRGMHKRLDHPATDPNQAHRMIVTGTDSPEVSAQVLACRELAA